MHAEDGQEEAVSQTEEKQPAVVEPDANGNGGSRDQGFAKAVTFHLEGRREDALRELDRMIDHGETSSEVLAGKGHILFELGRYDESAKIYGGLLKNQPDDAIGRHQLALCLQHLERWDEAAAQYRRMISAGAHGYEIGMGLGTCLLHLSEPAEAAGYFDQCLADKPGDEKATFGKAVAKQLLREFDEARGLYEEVLAARPDAVDALTNLVAIGIETGSDTILDNHAEHLLSVDPESLPALSAISSKAFRDSDHNTAAEVCEKIVALSTEDFTAWYNLGVARQRLEMAAEAAEAYRKAIEVRPDAKHAWLHLAVVLEACGDRRAARESLEEALSLDPDFTEAAGQLAWMLEQDEELAGAEKLYEQICNGENSNENAAFHLGVLRCERGDYADGIEALRSCLKTRAKWPEALWQLGRAYWLSGDRETARKTFEQVLEMEPSSPESLRALASLDMESGEYEKFLGWHGKLSELGEKSAELSYNAGLAHQSLGHPDEAIRHYRDAIGQNPDFAEALLNLGHALRSAGSEEEAVSLWRRALEVKPSLARDYFQS